MPFVVKPLPSLVGGVSQLPATIRDLNNLSGQDNAFSSITEGLHKRNPTEHVAKLTNTIYADAYAHTINRDGTEKYSVIVTNGSLQVFDINGVQKTVTYPNGTSYVSTATPSSDIRMVTVLDYTFVLNKAIPTAMTAAVTTGTFRGSKFLYTDLAGLTPALNDVWEIAGDPSSTLDNFYVKWDGAAWRESAKVGILSTINPSTMPMSLVRNVDGTFTLKEITWNQRLIGDDNNSPLPGFIGRKINDIYFFKNRLGFIADEKINMSRAGDFFNHFNHSVWKTLDADPIDISVAYSKVSVLRHAVATNEALILCSDLTQFVLTSQGSLTSKTVAITPATERPISKLCRPVLSGSNLYLPSEKNNYLQLSEYFVYPNSTRYDSIDITQHVPKYILGNAFKMTVYHQDDTVFVLSKNLRNCLYVYKTSWKAGANTNNKEQSSWSRWLLKPTDTILTAEVLDTYLYLVIQRADGIYLERIQLQVGSTEVDLDYLVCLDRKLSLIGVYNPSTNTTLWTLPYSEPSTMEVILNGSFIGKQGQLLVTSRPSPTTIETVGNFSSSTAYIGRTYKMECPLSPQYIRNRDGAALLNAKLKLKKLAINCFRTGYFQVEVTPHLRDKYTYTCSGESLGSTLTILGKQTISDGTFFVPILSDGATCLISLVSESHLPCFFHGAEWEGTYSIHAQMI